MLVRVLAWSSSYWQIADHDFAGSILRETAPFGRISKPWRSREMEGGEYLSWRNYRPRRRGKTIPCYGP